MPFLPLPPAIPTASDEEYARQRRFGGDKIPAPRDGSKELKRIVLKACAFDPNERYQTAREMWTDLNALAGGAPQPAQPVFKKDRIEQPAEGTVGPVFKKDRIEQPAEGTVGPNFKRRADEKIIDPNKTVGPVFNQSKKQQEQPKKKRKIWPIVAALAVCVILGGVLLLSRPSVTWKAPSGDILGNYLIDGYSAVGCYEVRTGIALSEKVNVEFKVGDAYNTMIVLITGKTLKTPVAVVVSDGVAAAKLDPNGTYLLQIEAEGSLK